MLRCEIDRRMKTFEWWISYVPFEYIPLRHRMMVWWRMISKCPLNSWLFGTWWWVNLTLSIFNIIHRHLNSPWFSGMNVVQSCWLKTSWFGVNDECWWFCWSSFELLALSVSDLNSCFSCLLLTSRVSWVTMETSRERSRTPPTSLVVWRWCWKNTTAPTASTHCCT